MEIQLTSAPCAAGQVLPLAAGAVRGMAAHCTQLPVPQLPVGTELCYNGEVLFLVTGRAVLPASQSPHALFCPLLQAVQPCTGGAFSLQSQRRGRALAWVTLSDKGSQGLREDSSGPAIETMVRKIMPLAHAQGFLLPDDAAQLSCLLYELAGQGYDCICTTGGTGLGARDVSPQATARVLEYSLPGFVQAMMQASLSKTPHAALSRALAGVLGKSIIINLPGSHKAVVENLAAVLPALPHALDKLQGDTTDCAVAYKG
jgi:molybdopterin adenylyltransferase